MRLGLIARADNIGLGVQTWEAFRHLSPARTMVIDLGSMNGNKLYPGRFPGAMFQKLIPRRVHVLNFIQGIQSLFTCETPYNYEFFEQCRKRRIKSVLQYNWEFLDYIPEPRKPRPAILVSPSYWNLDEASKRFGAVYLPVPVNREVLKFDRKKQFKNFLHLAGIRVDHDRNGTVETLKAFEMLKRDDIKLTVKCQNKNWVDEWKREFNSPNIEIVANDCENYFDNYYCYDCLIMPRKYGGLCLPMQEACSKGMPVIMTNISPNDRVLPSEWLVEAEKTSSFMARCEIPIHSVNVIKLAVKISEFADMNEEQAGNESDKADKIAEKISWTNLLPEYQRMLE